MLENGIKVQHTVPVFPSAAAYSQLHEGHAAIVPSPL